MTENPILPYSNFNNFSPPIGKKVINKTLYNYIKPNYKLYNLNGSYFGKSTCYTSIAHNGTDIGSIGVVNPDNMLVWIKGYVHSKYKDGFIIDNIIYG